MSNSLVHVLVNALFYVLLVFLVPLPFQVWDLILFVLYGTVLDIDHAIFFVSMTRPLTRANLAARLKKDYAEQVPHFYICHSVEFEVILMSFVLIFPQIPFFFWLFLGWSLHLLTDMGSYFTYYHHVFPW